MIPEPMFYNEASFWAFMASVMGFVFWMIKVIFMKVERANTQKANLEMSVERLKADNISKSIDCIQEVLKRIEPIVEHHDQILSNLNGSIKAVGAIEGKLTEMMKGLDIQYASFQDKIIKTTASFQLLVDRVDKLGADFVDLRNGFLLVKNGKK